MMLNRGPGRVELMPEKPNKKDEFLVVLLPTLKSQKPSHCFHYLEHGNDYDVEIIGNKRMTTWWFSSSANSVRIEIHDSNGTQTHDLLMSILPPPRGRLISIHHIITQETS